MNVAIPQEVLFRKLGRESVLLHLETGQYYGLDEVGTMIWILLVEGTTVPEIERRILEEYDADAEQVHGDVDRILRELQSKDLLELKGESGG